MVKGFDPFTKPVRSATPRAPGVVDTSVIPKALGNLAGSFQALAGVLHRNKQEGVVLEAKIGITKEYQELEQSLEEETDGDLVMKRFEEVSRKIQEKWISTAIDENTKRRIRQTGSYYMLKSSAKASNQVLKLQNAKQRGDLFDFIDLMEVAAKSAPSLDEYKQDIIDSIDGQVEAGSITEDYGVQLKNRAFKRMDAARNQQELGDAEALLLANPDAYMKAKKEGLLGETLTSRQITRLDRQARAEKVLQGRLRDEGLPTLMNNHVNKIWDTGVADAESETAIMQSGNAALIAKFKAGVKAAKDGWSLLKVLEKTPTDLWSPLVEKYMQDTPIDEYTIRLAGERRVEAGARAIGEERRQEEFYRREDDKERARQEAARHGEEEALAKMDISLARQGLRGAETDYLAGVVRKGEGGASRKELLEKMVKGGYSAADIEDFKRNEGAAKEYHTLLPKLKGMNEGQREKAVEDFLGDAGPGFRYRDILARRLKGENDRLTRGEAVKERERVKNLLVGATPEMNAHITSIMNTGQGIPGFEDRIRASGSKAHIKQLERAKPVAQRYFKLSKALETATPAVRAAIEASGRPTPGSPTYDVELNAHKMLLQKIQQIAKAQKDDPAGYVERFGKTGPNDGSKAAIALSLSAQTAFGIKPYDQRPLGKAWVEDARDRIKAAVEAKNIDEPYKIVKEALNKAGPFAPMVMRQFMENKVPEYVKMFSVEGIDARVARIITISGSLSEKDSTDLVPIPEERQQLDEESAAASKTFVDSLPPGLAEERLFFTRLAKRYARVLHSEGDSNPVQNAIRDIFPNYTFVGRVRVPRDVAGVAQNLKVWVGDPSTGEMVQGGIHRVFQNAYQRLFLDKLSTLAPVNLDPNMPDSAFSIALRSGRVEFRTTGDNKGVRAYMGTIQLIQQNGSPIGFTFAEMLDVAKLPPEGDMPLRQPAPSLFAPATPSIKQILERQERLSNPGGGQ